MWLVRLTTDYNSHNDSLRGVTYKSAKRGVRHLWKKTQGAYEMTQVTPLDKVEGFKAVRDTIMAHWKVEKDTLPELTDAIRERIVANFHVDDD